jgi:hypothetical protein
MPDIPSDGNIRVTWVPGASGIANKFAPTVAELNAGLLLTSILAADGFTGWQADNAKVNARKLDSTFTAQGVGTVSIDDAMMRFFKQSGTDTIFTTLTKNAVGFVVVRPSLASATAWASSQLLIGVYPAICMQRRWLDREENTMERYEVPIAISAEPAFDVTVA